MKKIFFMMLSTLLLLGITPAAGVAQTTSIPYIGSDPELTLSSPWTVTHWDDVWDLTQGDLTLSYTIDMNGLNQPGNCATYDGSTLYAEVGLRGEGAGDFNPGPFNVYQGHCGGWMTSDDDTWNDKGDGLTESCVPKDSTQDLDDKHCLSASGGRGDRDYDVLLSDPDFVGPTRQDPWYPGDPTKVIGAYGSFNNVGIWWDRDGVDPWQSTTYANTLGIYHIVITYHAIDDGLGVMFATVNGLPQGFYADPANWDGTPEYIPAGLSFKGDMKHMQVFAGVWGPNNNDWGQLDKYGLTYFDYGSVTLSDMTVTGYLGTSDPLVADFFGTPTDISDDNVTVQFTDATHGGMPPYTYAWDFGDGSTSTEQNPTHTYGIPGEFTVTLTVTPFRCVPKTITKTFPGTGTPGYWMNHPEAWPVEGITIGGKLYTNAHAIALMKKSTTTDVTYILFQALVAAKLNVLIGNDPSCIEGTIAEADAWMTAYPVGSKVKAGGKNSPWRTGEPLYLKLDSYNNGLDCAPSRDLIAG